MRVVQCSVDGCDHLVLSPGSGCAFGRARQKGRHQVIIKRSQQATNLAHLHKTIPYAVRKPSTRDDAQMIHRLAVKAQALAVEYGEELSWRTAISRARQNLVFVRAMAGVKGVA